MQVNDNITGRTARLGEECDTCAAPAVSVFTLDSKDAVACERHIIPAYEALNAPAPATEVYQRGSKTERARVTHLTNGTKVLVQRRESDGTLWLATKKTGALIATVTGKRKGEWRSYILTTDLGELGDASAVAALWTMP